MSRRKPEYPFTPLSAAYLTSGDFWGIALANGRHAAGVVVSIPTSTEAPLSPTGTKNFTAGLLSWSGEEPPTADLLHDADLLDWGSAHVRTVTFHDQQIRGHIDQPLTQIRMLSHRMGGDVRVYSNGLDRGSATETERGLLPIKGTYGLSFVNRLADRVFVRGLPIARLTD